MYGFEITMTLEEVTPINQRTVNIPSDLTFEKLHEIISVVFNLDFKSKYSFTFDDFDLAIYNTQKISRDTIDARYEKIDKYFQSFAQIYYSSNFWRIIINIEQIDYDKVYPQIVNIRGFYNPLPEIKSADEFSNLIEMKMNIDEANKNQLRLINKLRRANKLKIQKRLMILFKIPYKVENRKIRLVRMEDTLDELLK